MTRNIGKQTITFFPLGRQERQEATTSLQEYVMTSYDLLLLAITMFKTFFVKVVDYSTNLFTLHTHTRNQAVTILRTQKFHREHREDTELHRDNHRPQALSIINYQLSIVYVRRSSTENTEKTQSYTETIIVRMAIVHYPLSIVNYLCVALRHFQFSIFNYLRAQMKQIKQMNTDFISPIINKKLSIIDRRLSIFDRRLSIFDRRLSIFDRRLPIFNRRLPIFNRRLSIFDRRLSIFNRRLSIFDRRLSIFDRILSIIDKRLTKINENQHKIIINLKNTSYVKTNFSM